MTEPKIGNAILALDSKSVFVIKDTKIEWIENPSSLNDQQIQAKLAELQAEYDALQYQRDRLQEYPSIQELVVALYDEEDKASIIERRNAVKAKYPKPE